MLPLVVLAPRTRKSTPPNWIDAPSGSEWGDRQAVAVGNERAPLWGEWERKFVTISALSAARPMRSNNVSSERPAIQHECGSSCVPMALRITQIGFRSAMEPRIAPAMRSLCRPTYFVSE